MIGRGRKATSSLFGQFIDLIDKRARKLCLRNMDWGFVSIVLSTKRNHLECYPWKDIFYLELCPTKKSGNYGMPSWIVAGIGSLVEKEITLIADLVPIKIQKMLEKEFFFKIITSKESIEYIERYYKFLHKRAG